MFFDTDVIIVGAGPAGSVAAYYLASQGIQVILLEKTQFPRYKVCGGGLTHKILKEVPFDLSPVIESTVHTFRFSHHFHSVYTRHTDDPLIYCAMRGDLDTFLNQQATGAGAVTRFGEQVVTFTQDESGVTVSTKERSFRTRLLIGAEGASGIVSRVAGLRDHLEMGIAWEAELDADPEDLQRFSGTVFLDWGTLPGGYAWVFPKKDHFSIGVGGPASLSKSMMPYYQGFVASISKDSVHSEVGRRKSEVRSPQSAVRRVKSEVGIRFTGTRSVHSWPIPVRTARSRFHSGRVLITGDAAGLGDPLTGEGIYYAVRSGKLAAESCLEFLSGEIRSMNRYSDNINKELMEELMEANRIKHIFNAVPGRIHTFVGENERAWRAFCRILRGERWYKDVRRGFGRWKYLWNLACFVAGFVERRKERNYKFRSTANNLNL